MDRHQAHQHHDLPSWCASFAVILLVCAFTLMSVFFATAHAPRAFADEGDSQNSTSGTSNNSSSAQTSTAADIESLPDNQISLLVTRMTSIITPDSGFDMDIQIVNKTDQELGEGELTLLTNHGYMFVARSDLQAWADGAHQIDTTELVSNAHVEKVAAHTNVKVTLHLDAKSPEITAFNTWGPRPLTVLYQPEGHDDVPLHTFVTRAREGLLGVQTPPLKMTTVLKLSSTSWQEDKTALTNLMTTQTSSTANASQTVALSQKEINELKEKSQLAATYPELQVIADPYTLNYVRTPHIQGTLQPADFDITTYARLGNPDAYRNAGISDDSWDAARSLEMYRSVIGDSKAQLTPYAWQGKDDWTYAALTKARAQGYEQVISTHGFDLDEESTLINGTYDVPTEAGNIRVLRSQPVLSSLASGSMSSDQANAERSSAGRVARFMAQSAFYQMEQPYSERNMLVCIGANASPSMLNAFMKDLRNADWLERTNLDSLNHTEPYASGDAARELVETATAQTEVSTDNVTNALQSLATSRREISRFTASIFPEEDKHASANGKLGPQEWSALMVQIHDLLALYALGPSNPLRSSMTQCAGDLARDLLKTVHINSSEAVNVVSESASLPVTVSNSLPYPVHVRVSAKTDSMEIVTSRLADTKVPPKGEAQVTFTIRVATSGTTIANESLVDKEGQPFGEPQHTTITSALQISDQSGAIFIVIAILLGVIGLWRQFHRKKDPDQ